MTAFPSHERRAFSGKALVIIRPLEGRAGRIEVKAKSAGLEATEIIIESK